MRRPAFIAKTQLPFPPVEQFERTRWVPHFITQVIRPATIGIHVVKVLTETLGEHPGYDVKILVMVGRQPLGVFLRLPSRTTRFRQAGGNLEFRQVRGWLSSLHEIAFANCAPTGLPRPSSRYSGSSCA